MVNYNWLSVNGMAEASGKTEQKQSGYTGQQQIMDLRKLCLCLLLCIAKVTSKRKTGANLRNCWSAALVAGVHHAKCLWDRSSMKMT